MKSVIRMSLIYYHPKLYITSDKLHFKYDEISTWKTYKNVQNFVSLTKCIMILLFFKSNLQHNAFL